MKKLILLCVLFLIGCSPGNEIKGNPDRTKLLNGEKIVDTMNPFEITSYAGHSIFVYPIYDEVNNLQCWYLEGYERASFSCLPFWMLFEVNQYYAGILKAKETAYGMSWDRYTIEMTIYAIPSNFYSEVDVGDCIEIRCEPDKEAGTCLVQSHFEDPLSKYYPFSCEE